MKEYLAGPSSSDIDRNNYISVMASSFDEAVRKARILNAKTLRGMMVIRHNGEDAEYEVSPVNHRAVERQQREIEREANQS